MQPAVTPMNTEFTITEANICTDAHGFHLCPTLTKAARDIILGPFVLRGAEDLSRGARLHQLAQQEERGAVADAGRLLQDVYKRQSTPCR